jgi:hypothetical protein
VINFIEYLGVCDDPDIIRPDGDLLEPAPVGGGEGGGQRDQERLGTNQLTAAGCQKVNQSQRNVVKSIVFIFSESTLLYQNTWKIIELLKVKSNVELLRWIAWWCTCLLYPLKEHCHEIFF